MYDTVKNKIYLLFLIKKYTFIYLSMFLIIFILDVSTKVVAGLHYTLFNSVFLVQNHTITKIKTIFLIILEGK